MPRFPALLALVALLLSVPLAAQQKLPSDFVKRVSAPPGRVLAQLRFDGERFIANTEDYAVLRRQAAPDATRTRLPGALRAKVLCIDATTTNGFFAAGTTGVEWMDWASKECSSTGIISRITLGYVTSAHHVRFSGPGGTIALSFYEGTTGFCSRGTVATTAQGNDARYIFLGLPASLPTVDFAGAFYVTAFLPDNDPICLSDGKVGWGYTFLDDDGTGNAQTGPLLVGYDASTCWNDVFDLWSRPDEFGTCAGSFFFGGCTFPLTFGLAPSCGGFYIQIWEEDCGGPGTQVAHVVAPNVFALEPGLGPDIGAPFSMKQTPLSPFSVMSATLHDASSFFAPGFAAGFLAGGSLLHALFGPAYLDFTPVFTAGSVINWGFAFPKNTGLCGADLMAQGFDITLGPLAITAVNAINMTVGG